jgi:hypothetical protein
LQLAWNNRTATENLLLAMDQKGPLTGTPAQQLENR